MHWKDMTLREQVFQTIVAASRVIRKEESIEKFFEKYPVGGLYFTKGAVPDLAPVMESGTTGGASDYLLRCKAASRYPLIVCADGANIDGDGKHLPPSSALGATGDEELAYRAGRAVGMQMNYNHVDWVLGPCIDLAMFRANDTISPQMTDDPALNARLFGAYIRGVQDMGIAACAKHFPGLGTHHVNFHYGPGQNVLDMDTWHKTYGVTYRSAFENGVLTVMTSHLTLAAYDSGEEGKAPPICTYSEKLTVGLLKKELGFRGAVVTDALCMGGLASGDQVMDAVNAFKSGADFLLWAPMEAGERIVEMIEAGEIPMSRLEDALTRIWRVRQALGMTDSDRKEMPADKALVDDTFLEIQRRAIALERNSDGILPLRPDKTRKILLIANTPDEGGAEKLQPLCEMLRARGFEVDFRRYLLSCWEDQIKEMTEGYDLVMQLISVPFTVGVFPDCASTTWAFHLVPKEKRMVVNFSLPYFFDDYYPEDHTFVNANQTVQKDSLELLAKTLTGELPFEGKTPFKLFH